MYTQQIQGAIENLEKTLEIGEAELLKLAGQAAPAESTEGAKARTEAVSVLIKQASELTTLICQQMTQVNLNILELFFIESVIALTIPPRKSPL